MDSKRFDRWTPTIAPSRRVLLGGIAGVTLGGLLGSRAEGVAAAPATPTAARTQKRLAKQSVLKVGLKWIESQQQADGSFLDPNAASQSDPVPPTVGTTASVVSLLIALRNAGLDVETDEAVAYLQQTDSAVWDTMAGVLGGYGGIAQVVMALVAAGADPRDVGGVDLVARLTGSWDAKTGVYGSLLLESALVVMALAAAGAAIEVKAIPTIVAAQIADGSWGYAGTTDPGSGDAGSTAYVVQALVAAGHGDDKGIGKAVAFFRAVQFQGREFAPIPDYIPDPNTTGLVLSALIAVGENPKAKKWGDPVSGLLEYQNDSGGFRTSTDGDPTEDLGSTIAALTALAGAFLPVLPVP
jgi:hypothetical protein